MRLESKKSHLHALVGGTRTLVDTTLSRVPILVLSSPGPTPPAALARGPSETEWVRLRTLCERRADRVPSGQSPAGDLELQRHESLVPHPESLLPWIPGTPQTEHPTRSLTCNPTNFSEGPEGLPVVFPSRCSHPQGSDRAVSLGCTCAWTHPRGAVRGVRRRVSGQVY